MMGLLNGRPGLLDDLLDPNVTRRGDFWPVGRTADGGWTLALPQGAIDAANSLQSAMDMPVYYDEQGQMQQNPAVTETALNTAMLAAPAGIASGASGVAMGAARPVMSREARRMARADKMFPFDAYHGTNKDFPEFGRRGGTTNAQSARRAYWFSDDPETASGYATLAADSDVQNLINASQQAEAAHQWSKASRLMREAEKMDALSGRGENVLPVRLRGNLKTIDMDGQKYDPDDVNLSQILDDAAERGFDGVRLTNFSDEASYGVYRPTTHYAIFDEKNIRSRFAKFDPKKKNSADLLAMNPSTVAGFGLLDREDR